MGDSLHSARLAAVKRYIDSHLADPSLTPANAAAALGISARQPHAEHRQKAQAVAQIRTTINKWRQYCESKAGGLTVRLIPGSFVSVVLRRSNSLMRR
jgi:hypothetical protein